MTRQLETIKITCSTAGDFDHPYQIEIEAVRHGRWAAHVAQYANAPRGKFSVTHIGCGLALPAEFESLEDAQVAALVLDTYLAAWDHVFDDLDSMHDYGIDDFGSAVFSLIDNLAGVPFTVRIIPGPAPRSSSRPPP